MEEPPGNLVKVAADVEDDDPWGRSVEWLWAEPVGEGRFKLWNVPWHARNLNWGDVVRCELDAGDLRVVEVVERSGHVGFSVYFFRETPEETREAVLRELERLGAWFEWYEPGGKGGSRLYAVDVPPEGDWEAVYEYLSHADEMLAFQTSWRGERPDGAV